MTLSRRGVIGGGLCACAFTPAAARVAPGAMLPLVDADYHPTDTVEGGLWRDFDRVEEELAASNLLLDAPGVHAYLVGIVHNLLGERARGSRLYLVRAPSFNASMAPNGMMIVNSGLLLRVNNEAQLAAVLGHESGHYLRRHSFAAYRDRVHKTGAIAFISAGANVMAGAAALAGGDPNGWINLANGINSNLYASMFAFDRNQESEADAFGLRLIAEAGYTPASAAEIWQQLIDERRASAAARSKHYRARSSLVDSHPPDAVRLADLSVSAREVAPVSGPGRDGRDAFRGAMAPIRAALFDEQVKQNDPGASLYLINAHAADGWDGTLRFYEGETYRLRDAPGDAAIAAIAFAAAITFPDAPPVAWRAHGYALMKAGNRDDGRRALTRYLDLDPHATDAAMVRFAFN
jgi:Zn-dependent protease with chaperone function